MNYTCKYCGKPIFWLYPDPTPRWVHGVNMNNWSRTPCYHYKDKPNASPFSFNNYIKLIPTFK